jgi:hypothetical protein
VISNKQLKEKKYEHIYINDSKVYILDIYCKNGVGHTIPIRFEKRYCKYNIAAINTVRTHPVTK